MGVVPNSIGRSQNPSNFKKNVSKTKIPLFFPPPFFSKKNHTLFPFSHFFFKIKTFKLRKVNHTLGDHRSGRAWVRTHDPTRPTADTCHKKGKNLRKKFPPSKQKKIK